MKLDETDSSAAEDKAKKKNEEKDKKGKKDESGSEEEKVKPFPMRTIPYVLNCYSFP